MGRNRTVSDKLKVEKYTIYKFYKSLYKEKLFYANRKYQRKLVWTLEEKKFLIDSLFRGYPIPMFLIALYKEDDIEKWEVIDGLQRMNAIISFIEGEFTVEYDGKSQYFNLDAFTGYGKKIEEGLIQQNEPTLPLEVCEKFLDYELAFSITGKADSDVEEIFRRINSSGRQLSSQDLRQAGVVGNFSDLVRCTAAVVRGDDTLQDVLELEKMPSISLENKNLGYGLKLNEIFWIEQGITSESAIRRSKDEEIVANIYLYLLTNGRFASSAHTLDRAYQYDGESSIKKLLDDRVSEENDVIYWMDIFSKTCGVLHKILEGDTFSNKLFSEKQVYNKDNCFIVVFCAIANLLLQGKEVANLPQLQKKFKLLGDRDLAEVTKSGKSNWTKTIRDQHIERVQNSIQSCFRIKQRELECKEWETQMVKFLEMASAETQMFDLKLGITDLQNGSLSESCIAKIVRTLAAMCNTHPGEHGYILLGVPDNDDAATQAEAKYGIHLEECKTYKILGIKAEAEKYYGNIDHYLRVIKECIEKQPITEEFKTEILSNASLIEYKDRILYLFECSSREPVFYNEKLEIRRGSHNHTVDCKSGEMNAVMRKFYCNE